MCPTRRCFSQKLIHFILFSLRERNREKDLLKKIVRCSHFANILGILYILGSIEMGLMKQFFCNEIEMAARNTDLLNNPTACRTSLDSSEWSVEIYVIYMPLSSCVKFIKQQVLTHQI